MSSKTLSRKTYPSFANQSEVDAFMVRLRVLQKLVNSLKIRSPCHYYTPMALSDYILDTDDNPILDTDDTPI